MKEYRILGGRGRITIPYGIRQRVGFRYNDVLCFTATEDGGGVIIRREKICDNCKTKAQPNTEQSETAALSAFLDGLTERQKKELLVHLVTERGKV